VGRLRFGRSGAPNAGRDPQPSAGLIDSGRAKSRHKKAENVRRCFKPSPEAIAELTGLLAPGDSRR
jgi:hypothetical protein